MRIAAVHALRYIYLTNCNKVEFNEIIPLTLCRRLIIHYVESGWFYRPNIGAKASAAKKVEEYNRWFQNQFSSCKDTLIQLMSETDDALHAVSIRTYMEVHYNFNFFHILAQIIF